MLSAQPSGKTRFINSLFFAMLRAFSIVSGKLVSESVTAESAVNRLQLHGAAGFKFRFIPSSGRIRGAQLHAAVAFAFDRRYAY